MTNINSQAFKSISSAANPAFLSRAISLINNSSLTSLEPMRAGIASGAVTIRLANSTDKAPPGTHAFYVGNIENKPAEIVIFSEFLQRDTDGSILQFVDDLTHEYQHHVNALTRQDLVETLRTGAGTPQQRATNYVTGFIDDETKSRLTAYEFQRQVALLPGTDFKIYNFGTLKTDPLYKEFASLELEADRQGLSGADRSTFIIENSRGVMAAYAGGNYRERSASFAALILELTPEEARAFRTAIQQDIRNVVPFEISTETYDDGPESFTVIYADGNSSTSVYDIDLNLVSQTSTSAPVAVTNLTSQPTITTLNDIARLIGSIQAGRPLPILNSGLRLLNNIVNPADGGTLYPGLASANNFVGGLASLYNLANALKNGDTLTQISATLNTLSYVNQTLPSLLGEAGVRLSEVLNGTGSLTNAVPGVLPAIGLIVAIKNEDPVGITLGLIGIANPALLTTPPAGWIVAGVLILQALLQDPPPEAWGTAKIIFDGNGQLQIDTVGESFGVGRVRGQLEVTLGVLNGMLAETRSSNPSVPLGLVAQRMPSITWRESRQGDPGYALLDIDPLTGEQRYPYLRFDDNGVPFSSNPAVWQPDPRDPGIRAGMTQQLIESALRRKAIAGQWEVDTARIQQDVGDPNAGLVEEERAAKSGLGATYDPITKKPVGQFRPVTLDLDGNGVISTAAKDDPTNATGFDWDDSGFYKQVAWVQPNDGFLFLDRNLNGVVDSGTELMSNSLVSDNYKGVRSLDWVDANRDGKIDSTDPVFKELKVWQDLNGDGDNVSTGANGSVVADAGELKSLSELGITELDYVNGRFVRNGNFFALKSNQLEADTYGTRVNLVENGIVVQDSDGTQKFIVTSVTSLEGGADIVSGLFEDGDPLGKPTTVAQEISIPGTLLLTNDSANPAVVATLRIESVNSATHGSVRLGEENGQQFVYFTPEANYNSTLGPDPSFDYVVRDVTGTQKTVTVRLPLVAVNDFATVDVKADAQRAIYGYSSVLYDYSYSAGTNEGEYVTVRGNALGDPKYAPYIEHVPQNDVYGFVSYGNGDGENTVFQLISSTPAYDIPHLTPIAYDSPNTGEFTLTDPDGPVGPSVFQVVTNPVYGKVTIDPDTGRWSYVGLRPAGIAKDHDGNGVTDFYVNPDTGAAMAGNTDSNRYGPEEEKFIDVFTVRVTDASGSSVDKNVEVTHYGPRPVPVVEGGGKKPIAIDLNGDGFSFTDVDDSNVFFDINGDGWRRKVAWLNPNDGLLAIDENNNGKVDDGLELSFARFKQGAQTDLQGLAAFDSNGDGKFTALDAKWAQFGVWQDANSNGVSDAGEFRGLGDLGITEVGLTSDGQFRVINGQTVHGLGTATKADGSVLQVADVTLKYTNETQVLNADGTTGTALLPTTQRGQVFMGTPDKDLVLGTQGSDRYVLGDGDDAVVDDSGDDIVDSGSGNDLINTGIGNDVVLAGAGDDIVFAGEGNDVVFGDDATGNGSDLIMLQGGNDVAFGGGGDDFISGGDGGDTISGNDGDDKLFGESGWDALFGGEGDDELLGMDGNDLLDAGNGNDLLAGGAGNDVMQGGAGNDIYEVNSAADIVDETINGGISGTAGTGDAGGLDTVQASINYTLGALIENLTLTGTSNLEGTGNASSNILVGNEASNTLYGLEGDDTLDGSSGADRLLGGVGNDIYVVDNAGDMVVELSGEGIDTVLSRISYNLNSEVENLTLVGVNAIDGTGNAVANTLTGNAGANMLDGGSGNDRLRGGGGNDRYRFGIGYGVDTIIDKQGQNTLVFGVGIEASDLQLFLDGSDLLIDLTQNGITTEDRVILKDWYLPPSERQGAQRVSAVSFASGLTLALDETALNRAPTVVDDSVAVSKNTLRVGGNVLANDSDPDEGNRLSVIGTGTFVGRYGTLVLSADGRYEYSVRSGGADVQALQDGQSLSDTFTFAVTDNASFDIATRTSSIAITVNGVNDINEAPILVQPVAAQSATELIAFRLALPANMFTDGNAADVLTFSAALIDGSALPAWLSFDASSRTFSGEPAYEDITAFFGEQPAVLNLRVSATDTQGASASSVFTLTVNQSPELSLVGTDAADSLRGASRNDQLYGGSGDDVLRGMRGNDLLDGGSGADQLFGGLGNDTFIVDDVGDQVTENQGEGTDTVNASISYELSANVENLTLTGLSAIDGTGNALNNTLLGNAASNTLDGGTGADELRGSTGNDHYVIDNAGDQVIELGNEGVDRVTASIDYSLTSNVENLKLAGNAVRATGNALDNRLEGNAGNNLLDGGSGIDTMIGAQGNDTYFVDNTEDVIIELAEEGLDNVVSSANYTLSANVDNLTLTGTALMGTGNELANTLTASDFGSTLSGLAGSDSLVGAGGNDVLLGGSENDTLVGGGGADWLDGGEGIDQMLGGVGDDRYVVDNANDQVIESASEGIDTVSASISYELTTNVENLSLIGENASDAIGNSLNNTLIGNSSANVLDGRLGADVMRGAGGNDSYMVDSVDDQVIESAGEGIDTVNASISYTLAANVEKLTLAGDLAIDGTGNELDNVLIGSEGTNFLDGRAGNDVLKGGAGNDSYRFGRGYGVDTIIDQQGQNTLLFGAGIEASDLRFGLDGKNLLIDVISNGVAPGDRVILQDWYLPVNERPGAQRISAIQFSSGLLIALDETALNTAPTVVADAASLTENTLRVSSNVLGNDSDIDSADVLSVMGAGTYVGLYGTLVLAADGRYEYALRSSDADVQALQNSQSVSDTFSFSVTDNARFEASTLPSNLTVTVNGVNDAPVLAQPITAQNATEIVAFSLVIPSGTFTDADAGEVLILRAALDDGGLLPSWLKFDASTLTFSGEPTFEDITAFFGAQPAVLNLRVTATDSQGESADSIFTLTVNQSPELTVVGTDGVDNLRGASRNDHLLGSAGDDVLRGMRGDDVLDGGIGADQMLGGLGNDTYIADNIGDQTVESVGEGYDTVNASVSYALSANIENLALTGSATIDATGNELDNILIGNAAANNLNGGLGADLMRGAAGDDNYVVDNTGDQVVETAEEGSDSVRALIDYSLSANVENLTLVGSALRATGNSLNNHLTGNAQANLLDGSTGDDTMIGGQGNDTYLVDTISDVVVELAGEGIDSVISTANYTLSSQVENLKLSGAALVGTGNESANTLTANNLGNTLSGLAGSDDLIGAAGDDVLLGGGDNDTLSGNGGADWLDGGLGVDQMVGGAGDDGYVVDDAGDQVIENVGEGTDTVNASISYALAAHVENLTLTGAFAIDGSGNALNNTLVGNAASNALDGGAGADVMRGAAGDDSYVVDDTGDVVLEAAAEGLDTVSASINYTLTANVERLTLTGNATQATGNELNNTLIGNTQANRLDGGAGTDTMSGGQGDDTYFVDNTADTVIELFDEGVDNVLASSNYTLGANVENLTLTDSATIGSGNELANTLIASDQGSVLFGLGGSDTLFGGVGIDRLFGGAGNDTLSGNSGADLLDGGAGVDLMSGGTGDDVYVVDSAGDQVIENTDEGTDTVNASISYVLTTNVENLTLVGNDTVNATGNTLGNTLTGNNGSNVLDGNLGADVMRGAGGDDHYVVDDAGDQVIEILTQGIDSVRSSISYTLTANVENLTLTGMTAIDGKGNELDNILVGNAGANKLDGGVGADVMRGAAGDDTYFVDIAGDLVIETSGEGTDSVFASIDYTLTSDVENLTLTDNARRATGNALNNSLVGNELANTLDGGAGIDTMIGAQGDDVYLVDATEDKIVELVGEGADSVVSSANYTLMDNVENLTLTGFGTVGTGNDLANNLIANNLGNTLVGLAGSDTLIGGTGADFLFGGSDSDTLQGNAGSDLLDGGTGTDHMSGGVGADSYVVDNVGDVVTEFFNQGYDQVSSSINYVLPQHVERLNLVGAALQGTGNDLDNALFGNLEANILDGASGIDQMSGAQGDDRYVVDNTLDTVIELAGQGIDTVYASVNYSTAVDVENLVLTGSAFTANGNELNNVLIGNAGNNTVNGGAGNDFLAGWLGNDLLDGGVGDDSYLYNQGEGRDSILDTSGVDTVRFGAGISLDSLAAREYILNGQRRMFVSVLNSNGEEQADQGVDFALLSNGVSPIEQFVLTNGQTFTLDQLKPPSVTTNGGNNNDTLTGSRANDTMDGGNGNDTLYGRTGNDTLYGGNGNDALFGEGGHDKVYGGNGDDRLEGGYGDDLLDGDNGRDILLGGAGNDLLYAGNDSDILDSGSGNDMLDGSNGEDELWAGTGNDTLYGGNDSDLLAAGAGDDTLVGDNGADVIVAGSGNDLISAGNDNDFVDAGAGNDSIDAGNGNDFIAGGKGNDTITSGSGDDLLALNRGDGQDTFLTQDWQQDTLSLGGGIRYADLKLKKSGNDLILDVGQGDQITFKEWYVGQSGIRKNMARLQVVTEGGDYNAASTDKMLNKKVVDFDFQKLTTAFDQARSANPALTEWSAHPSLSSSYLQASNTQAIGGDLAYRYATLNSVSTEGASYGDLDWKTVRSRTQGLNGSLQNLNALVPGAINPWVALQAGTSLIVEQPTGASSPITPVASLTQDQLVIAALGAQAQISGQSQVSWR